MRSSFYPKTGIGLLLTSIALVSAKAASFNYAYDSLNRITNATYSDGSRDGYSYDPAGNRISRVTRAATSLLDTTPPSVPTNLVTTDFVPSQLSIAWNQAVDTGGSGLAGYYVYANGSWVATTAGTNFTLSGLSLNTQYCITVAAFDHDGNISPQSTSICMTTPVFQQPFLSSYGFSNGHLQIGVIGGTVGPYDVWGSSNLFSWQRKTNLSLPLSGGFFAVPDLNTSSTYFYRLSWRTNLP